MPLPIFSGIGILSAHALVSLENRPSVSLYCTVQARTNESLSVPYSSSTPSTASWARCIPSNGCGCFLYCPFTVNIQLSGIKVFISGTMLRCIGKGIAVDRRILLLRRNLYRFFCLRLPVQSPFLARYSLLINFLFTFAEK